MRAILFLLLFAAAAGRAQTQVPENLKPPPSEAVLLKAVGKGRQIYACNVKDGKFAWTLERPQADLFDARGNVIGRHYQGPTWEASDGSKVTGQLLQQANAPRPGAIPWLLLKAKSNAGAGIFGKVTYIQRLNTVSGVAPAPSEGCDQGHTNAEVAIEYQADYYFYGKK
jgi:hypothetical protein